MGRVVLVTGPAGSGKSTLASYMEQQLEWKALSEDTYWVENGWGSGRRTPEQETAVQRQVLDDLLTICRSGRCVVLEFILYSDPPNPLSAYVNALDAHSIAFEVVALKPTASEIMRRIVARGRPHDLQHLSGLRRDVGHQVKILESDALRSHRVIDTTDMSVDEVYRTCLDSLGRLLC